MASLNSPKRYPAEDCELPDRGNMDGIVRGQDIITSGSRRYGATMKQFSDFVRAADAGLRVEMHGQNYVAMSRNLYEELIAKAKPVTFSIDEASELTDDQLDAIRDVLPRPIARPNPELLQEIGSEKKTSPRPKPNPTGLVTPRRGVR